MTTEKFYGSHLPFMEAAKGTAILLLQLAAEQADVSSPKIVSRIKKPESMEKKILADKLPVNMQSALQGESDAIGVRMITDSVSNVYKVYEELIKMQDMQVVQHNVCFSILHVKDYIKNPKDSGYRSLHVIAELHSEDPDFSTLKVEMQLRTSIMDCWASLEHLVMYKQVIDLTPEVLDILDTYRVESERELAGLK